MQSNQNVSFSGSSHNRGINFFSKSSSKPLFLNLEQVRLIKFKLSLVSSFSNSDLDYIFSSLDTLEFDLTFKRYHWYTFYNHRKFGKVLFSDGVIRLVPRLDSLL